MIFDEKMQRKAIKLTQPAPRAEMTSLVPPDRLITAIVPGVATELFECCYVTVGTIRLSQRWLEGGIGALRGLRWNMLALGVGIVGIVFLLGVLVGMSSSC